MSVEGISKIGSPVLLILLPNLIRKLLMFLHIWKPLRRPPLDYQRCNNFSSLLFSSNGLRHQENRGKNLYSLWNLSSFCLQFCLENYPRRQLLILERFEEFLLLMKFILFLFFVGI